MRHVVLKFTFIVGLSWLGATSSLPTASAVGIINPTSYPSLIPFVPGPTQYDGWNTLTSAGVVSAATAEWGALASPLVYPTPLTPFSSIPNGTVYSNTPNHANYPYAYTIPASPVFTVANSGNPTWPGNPNRARAWYAPIPSMAASSADAVLVKLANGTLAGAPYLGNAALHVGSTQPQATATNADGGRVAVVDYTPLANLKSVVFQLEVGQANGYDLLNNQLPRLSYNGGSQNLAPAGSIVLSQVPNGTFDPPGDDPIQQLYKNTYLVQYDLTSIGSPIQDFQVAFNMVHHSDVFALRLDQYDSYQDLFYAPEPGSLVIWGCCLPMLMAARRRKRLAQEA